MPISYDSSKTPSSKLHFERQSHTGNKSGHNALETETLTDATLMAITWLLEIHSFFLNNFSYPAQLLP